MYNTNFVVRYNDIERELVQNLQRRMMQKREKDNAAIIAIATETIFQREKQIKELQEKEQKKKRGRKKVVKELDTKVLDTKVEENTNVAICQPCIKKEKDEKKEKKEDDDDDEEIEYTMDDVRLICDKLYRDELLSVFNVESVNDRNVDLGITSVIEKMIVNSTFRVILEEIKTDLVDINTLTGTPTEVENMIRNLEYLIFVTLFNQQIFYIAHKCICQLFTIGSIDPELVVVLKQKLITFFNR